MLEELCVPLSRWPGMSAHRLPRGRRYPGGRCARRVPACGVTVANREARPLGRVGERGVPCPDASVATAGVMEVPWVTFGRSPISPVSGAVLTGAWALTCMSIGDDRTVAGPRSSRIDPQEGGDNPVFLVPM